MENKKLTEQDLDYEGWKKYIESLYDFYRRVDEDNEKEKIEKEGQKYKNK